MLLTIAVNVLQCKFDKDGVLLFQVDSSAAGLLRVEMVNLHQDDD